MDSLNRNIPVAQPHYCTYVDPETDLEVTEPVYRWMALRSKGPNILGPTTFCDQVKFAEPPLGLGVDAEVVVYLNSGFSIVQNDGTSGDWYKQGEGFLAALRTWRISWKDTPSNTVHELLSGPITAIVGGANVGLEAVGNATQKNMVVKATLTATVLGKTFDANGQIPLQLGLAVSTDVGTLQPREESQQKTVLNETGETYEDEQAITCQCLCVLSPLAYVYPVWMINVNACNFEWIDSTLWVQFVEYTDLDFVPIAGTTGNPPAGP
jgi:hypothetical protein